MVIISLSNKKCKGCKYAGTCRYSSYIIEEIECPCVTCLIKGICSTWIECESWEKYRLTYNYYLMRR